MTAVAIQGALAGALLLALLYGVKKLYDRLRALFVTGFGRAPFESRPVMNRGERDMYLRLLQAAPHGTLVLAQVQLISFMQVRGLNDRAERWKYLNRIIRLSVDFLVIDAKSMAPLVGIELDGATHEGSKSFVSGQMDADSRKNQAFKAAGVSLLRVPVRSGLGVDELRERIRVELHKFSSSRR